MPNTVKVLFYQRQMGACLHIPLVWSLVVKKFAGTDFTASIQNNNHEIKKKLPVLMFVLTYSKVIESFFFIQVSGRKL